MGTLRILFFVCLLANAARATPLEEAYLAARDHYIHKINRMYETGASPEEVDAEYTKARADLEMRLLTLLGDVSVKGFPSAGKINLDSLSEQDMGYGMLDGLVYSEGGMNAPRLVVTTRNLLSKWLAASTKENDKDFRMPVDLGAALRLDRFCTSAIGYDGTFARSANLVVTAPRGSELVIAVLGGWTQEATPSPADSLILTLIKGERIYIGSLQPKTAVGEIAACEAIWHEAWEKSEKDSFERGRKDYQACYMERAPKEPFYPLLVKEAQGFADRIAGN